MIFWQLKFTLNIIIYSRTKYIYFFQFWNLVPDVFYSFSIALLLALGVEGPFRRLEKYFLTKRVPTVSKHEKVSNSCDANSEETKKNY